MNSSMVTNIKDSFQIILKNNANTKLNYKKLNHLTKQYKLQYNRKKTNYLLITK